MSKLDSKLTRKVIIEKQGHSAKTLKKMLDEAIKERDVAMSDFNFLDPTLTSEKVNRAMDVISQKANELDRKYRMIKSYNLSKIEGQDNDIMSLEEFISCCEDGGFIDYDGFGRYMENGMETNITIYPSDVAHGSIRTEFKQIIWFNR